MIEPIFWLPVVFIGSGLLMLLAGRKMPLYGIPIGIFASLYAFGLSTGLFKMTSQGSITIPVMENLAWFSVPFFSSIFSVRIDGLSMVTLFAATAAGLAAHIFSAGYIVKDRNIQRYFVRLSFLMGGITGVILADNLLILLLFWEITALAATGLIAFRFQRTENTSSASYFFTLSQIGSAVLLAALVYIFAKTGTVSLDQLRNLLKMNFLDGKTIITVSALIGAAALIKASQLPFTSKTAQTAMATAPSAAVITAVSAPLAVYLLVRFYPFFEAAPAVSAAIVWIGALSALTAAFCAWGSSDIMRALAYAMISELGLAVSCAGTNGAYPAAFHAFCLAFYGSLLIFAGGVIISGKKRRSLNEMGGLRYAMPVTYLVFIAAGASLAGIPPFTGFYSKGLMLSAFWQSPSGVLPVIILTYIMGGLYTGRIFLKAFHGERGQYTQNLTVDEGSSSTKGVMIFLAAACAVIGWTLTHNRIFSSITALADNTGSFSVEGKAIAFSCGAAGFALALLVFFEKPAGLWKYLKKLSWPAKAAENDFGFEFLIRRAGKAGGMAVTAFDHTERAIDGSLSFILSKLPKGGTPDTNTATKAILTASFIISLFVLFVALG